MAQEITINDAEPVHEWIIKLSREAPKGRLYPEEYDWKEVLSLAQQFSEELKKSGEGEANQRYTQLRSRTTLSEREAEVVAMKELGMAHSAIAFYYGVMDRWTVSGDNEYPTSASTVDEYSRRARQKYKEARRTVAELESIYGEGDG